MKYLHLLRLASNTNFLRLAKTHPKQAIAILLMTLLSAGLMLGAWKAPTFVDFLLLFALVIVCGFILFFAVGFTSEK